MTTTTAAAPPATSLLPRSVRTTGHARVGLGVLAAGDLDGPAHLSVPLERVVSADLRLRTGMVRHTVTVNAPAAVATPATAALEVILGRAGVGPVEAVVDLRLPHRPSSGSDVEEAAVLAVVDATCRAVQEDLSATERAELAARALARPSAGLAYPGATITRTDGTAVTSPAASGLLLVVLQPVHADLTAGDSPARAAGTQHGTLTAAPEPANGTALTAHELARWLYACAAAPQTADATDAKKSAARSVAAAASAALDKLARADRPARHLGVIGGHTPTSPVATMFDPRDILEAQRLLAATSGLLPDGWKASITRTPTTAH